MTTPLATHTPALVDQNPRINSRSASVKNLAQSARSHLTHDEALSELVVKALWESFPECRSERDLAEVASPYFRDKHGKNISPRTILYWLRGQTLPSALHLFTLQAMQPKMFVAHIVRGFL